KLYQPPVPASTDTRPTPVPAQKAAEEAAKWAFPLPLYLYHPLRRGRGGTASEASQGSLASEVTATLRLSEWYSPQNAAQDSACEGREEVRPWPLNVVRRGYRAYRESGGKTQ